jgi:hypothetical protein
LWSLAALASTHLAARSGKLAPGLHGTLYLAAAAMVSGLFEYGRRALAGAFPPPPGAAVVVVTLAAALCYARWWQAGSPSWSRLPRLLTAALAVFGGAALAVAALSSAAAGGAPGASVLATLRTLVTCAAALALGYTGSRWRRTELVWIAYAAIAFGSLKLLLEDLRQGGPVAIAVSLVGYGAVLILVPRMVRGGAWRS